MEQVIKLGCGFDYRQPTQDFWITRLRQQSAKVAPPAERRVRERRQLQSIPSGERTEAGRGCQEAGMEMLAQLQVEERVAGAAEFGEPPGQRDWDSRYRGIGCWLNSLLELFHQEPERNLTPELDHLLEVMTEHFVKENASMTLVGFPQALVHRLRHQTICFRTAKLRYRFSKGEKVSHDELGFIRLLWQEHIELHDAVYERFLVS